MSNPAEREATQTLLDIAIKASKRRSDGQANNSKASRSSTKENSSAPAMSAPSLRPPGMGRIVTSGDSLSYRHDSDTIMQRDSSIQSNRNSAAQKAAQERVTVIVQRPASPKEETRAEDDAKNIQPSEAPLASTPPDMPVPTSAFAPSLKSAGPSIKSSTELYEGLPGKDGSGEEDAANHAEEQAEGEGQQPAKRQKMSRAISINTILQRVGSGDGPLKDVAGTAPQTVQEMVATPLSNHMTDRGLKKGEPLKMGTNQIGQSLTAQSIVPALPPRKSSDQSTLDVHKQIALQDSSNTVETVMRGQPEGVSLSRALSAERDLHLPPRAPMPAPPGRTPEGGLAPAPSLQQSPRVQASSQESEEGYKLVMWTGKVKHRLKTLEGASTVELFSISVLVPEKLMEQMPPTLFVSALAGRANVKLGKHFVAQCRLEDLEEKQKQKARTLAIMKLVAICELQHCTLTLVPFTDKKHCLRIVGFLIDD